MWIFLPVCMFRGLNQASNTLYFNTFFLRPPLPCVCVCVCRHRVGCDRGHRGGGPGVATHVEGPHHHTRQAGVCTLREGTHDGQMGHGESMQTLVMSL